MMTSAPVVVATCSTSRMTDLSSCDLTNSASTVQTRVASAPTAVALASSEWSSDCVCADTGRRPVMMITIPEVVVGAACKAT